MKEADSELRIGQAKWHLADNFEAQRTRDISSDHSCIGARIYQGIYGDVASSVTERKLFYDALGHDISWFCHLTPELTRSRPNKKLQRAKRAAAIRSSGCRVQRSLCRACTTSAPHRR